MLHAQTSTACHHMSSHRALVVCCVALLTAQAAETVVGHLDVFVPVHLDEVAAGLQPQTHRHINSVYLAQHVVNQQHTARYVLIMQHALAGICAR
jgi:hypothetical protein